MHPDNKHDSTVKAWGALLPRLEQPFLQYRRDTHGRVPPIIPTEVNNTCGAACVAPYTLLIQCLYPTRKWSPFRLPIPHNSILKDYKTVRLTTCDCLPAPILLLQHGLFAAAPTRPRTAISIDLLDLYRGFFERSCDAITALTAALHSTYTRRGLCVDSQRNLGMRAVDPFRSALSNAVLWSSNLQTRLDARVSATLADAATALGLQSTTSSVPGSPPGSTPAHADADAAILRERCPACFGLETWGRPLKEGGDVQLGGDGCFSYRHLKSAGDGPISYTPDYFIPKEKMIEVKARIDAAKDRPPAKVKPAIPQEALDACESSWEAANEKKQKADPQRYDASGIFAITCRHSQVLFLCNIDTPGEQQQYIVAGLEVVQEHLPPQATILQNYDVGCLTDHSCNLFPLLTPGLRKRVSFAINAMHAYGHQWVCQLVYNPRMRPGCGLTDGEGVERIWSRIRKLIPITRNQWNSQRIWMIDLYMSFINAEGLTNLGTWLQRQEAKNVAPRLAKAKKMLRDCRVPTAELRSEWAAQKVAQSSIRAHAPARLKRELDKVLALQVQIDAVECSILEVKTTIASDDSAATETRNILRRLQETHQALSEQAESLYASLNISTAFPELRNLPLEFVRTLLMMRDLKMNIRKRAVGSFQEWEMLDRAVSGRREPLGTKLYQMTRKAITRRQPALTRALKKFNGYCARLELLRPPGCNIPIPAALPTTLDGLRSDPSLHQDVWIQSSNEPVPRWLEDHDVRDGIRSLHIIDRCAEEADRLNLERRNLDLWLKEELAVVAKVISSANDPDLQLPLVQRQQELEYLRRLWAPALCLRPQPQAIAATSASATTSGASTTGPRTAAPPASTTISRAVPSHSSAHPPRKLQRGVGNVDDDNEVVFEGPQASTDTDIVAPEELDPGLISDTDEPLLVGDMLERRQEIVRDRRRRQLPEPTPGVRGDTLEIQDLDTLTNPRGRLTGCCLNGVAAALHAFFRRPDSPCRLDAANCAVLSTVDLHRIRYKASDAEVWRFLSRTTFWEKSTWLVPIHRRTEEHWVLAVIPVYQRRVFLFDSLASKAGWRRDLKDIMTLITRMLTLAERHNHPMNISVEEDAWEANPLFEPPRQTNGYDCSVWVLCMMAAFMRGYCSTSLSERDMGDVRRHLTDHIFTLPAR
ncbi:hypothetical protein B0H13DRAFT_1622406 [Mycena leptocephala]|nr:hypothetical protein B0H13DRAFT_1622406 [Mycena leptocephala]